MEGIMVSAATGAMNSLLTKLTALMGEEYKAQKGVIRDIAFLRDELSSMNALLEKLAGVETLDPQVREWRNQVREMAYDIEDYIDSHMFRLRYELGKPTGAKEFFRRSVRMVKDFGAQREIAGQIQELKARLVDAGQRRDRYKLDEVVVGSGSANCVSIDPRLPALYVEAANLVGIDGPMEDIIKLVADEELYVRKEDYAIAEQSDEESLINALREFLKDKRYIIVIDDIWSIQVWKTIKCSLPENSFCSRIIVTTRNINVAKSCCSPYGDLAFKLRPLSEADSKTLFYRRVFGSEIKCPLHLKEVSTEIINKCGGLPLAIITMGSLLSTKSDTREEWISVRNSIGLGLEKNPDVEEMGAILSLSYNDLPCHLKTCLLYLSVYPEDYEIQMEDLVRRWIAEGFVKVEGRRNLMDEGKHYFNELINRSTIQPLDISYNGQAKGCLVHDMILDLIKSKAVEENFPHILVSKHKVCRLSTNCCGQGNVMPVSTMITAHVRSLSIFGYVEQMPLLLEFPALRVLALDRSKKLESGYLKNIGKLFLLRYLRIEGSNITQLPEQIGELQCLEILDLQGTSIRELPKSIAKLRQLKWMLTAGVKLPQSVGKMQGLEELSSIVVDESTPLDSLQELGSLTRLRTLGIKWCISDSHVYKIAFVHNLVSSLGKLGSSNLRHLHVKTDGRQVRIPLDSWSLPPHLLRELINTSDLCICKIPEWITSLVNLNCLQISIDKLRQENLHVLGELPTLLSLTLYSYEAEPKERLVVCNDMFQCLKQLFLWCEVGVLMFEAGAMPRLQALEFQIMANEARSMCNAPDLGICHLSSLSNLCVWIDCGDVRTEEVHALEAAIRTSAKLLPNSPVPYFHRLYRRQE
ncbi:putative disease resistance RPP13-like protein 3 [Panicum miliaceum]|uniref:Disease resistance RPP13-like protein 3 n=1 Tax=Panicum miliaceum TaxID=4540 RepID=A0A3L6T4S4_PANMI|nr:putative disease resistance RPP13-like protein 3 [Panicum miliaceum]